MKDQLISFDTAKLAKEKGFNIMVDEGYCVNVDLYKRHNIVDLSGRGKINYTTLWTTEYINQCGTEHIDDYFYAPTQSLLQKWLRETPHTHNRTIEIIIEPYLSPEPRRNVAKLWQRGEYIKVDGIFDTYELALEAGLQEALKLIK